MRESITQIRYELSKWLRERDLNPPVLHFHCGKNAAVGSAALTVHRTVVCYFTVSHRGSISLHNCGGIFLEVLS